jgi:pimeloyl-ACP methyl ester carboxylesterase
MRTLSLLCCATTLAFAQGRGPRPTPPIPALGIAVPEAERAELEVGLKRLQASTAKLVKHPLLPDVLIYQEAVRYALQYNEFLKPDEIGKARKLLEEGQQRADQLAQGQAPWATATGLVVRGYVSKIDKSIQPYGLVVPASYSATAPHRWRLDTWFHGRSETLTEVNFLSDRERNVGEFAPRDTIMLHLYGRFCNASKLAGEVDFFEALDAVKRAYPIDENRIVIRGFSMGGASAWHIGAHFAGLWAAVAPGAGFSETAQFLHLNLIGPDAPPAWEQQLFHLYDMNDYAINLTNTATIAYNGEIDGQKQAADVMEKAMAEEGMRLTRVIGPNTPHRYHPDSKVEIDRMLDAIVSRGRDPYPRKVRFTTWTLAYNRMNWVTIDELGKHWQRARINAEMTGDAGVAVETSNVTAFTLDLGPGGCPFDLAKKPVVTIDGQKIQAPPPQSDRSWSAMFVKRDNKWASATARAYDKPHKVHGLQGPIDDAFLDSFVFVTPTGTPVAPGVAGWVAAEQKHAIAEWRHHFRGDAQVREDKDVSDADIAASNLVLWGDPGSNRILARFADKLPVKWTADAVIVGKERYPAGTHAPILVYPNPLNPKKYIVLNSGFTFREFDYMNNARQIPKLPDWAVVDTTTPPNDRYPGKIVQAGFFNEDWMM